MNRTDDRVFHFAYKVWVYKEITYEQFKETGGDDKAWEKLLASGKQCGNHHIVEEDYDPGFDCEEEEGIEEVFEQTRERVEEFVEEAKEIAKEDDD